MYKLLKITCNESGKIFIGYTTIEIKKYMKTIRRHIRHTKEGKRSEGRIKLLSLNLKTEILEINETYEINLERKKYFMNKFDNCINDRDNLQ